MDLTECQRFLPDEVAEQDWTGRERCGFVREDADGFCWFYEVPNEAKGEGDFFEISAEVYYEFVMAPGFLLGVWHSHPGGKPYPSSMDWEWHPDPKLLLFIVADGVARCYFDKKEVGLPWEHANSTT